MQTKEAADAALIDPNPIIDGRKANINLAYLGIKSKVTPPKSQLLFYLLSEVFILIVF